MNNQPTNAHTNQLIKNMKEDIIKIEYIKNCPAYGRAFLHGYGIKIPFTEDTLVIRSKIIFKEPL